MKPTVETKEMKAIERGIAVAVAKAEKISLINSDSELEAASEVLSQLNQYNDSLKAEKKKLTEPANSTLKAIKAFFAPIEERVLPHIDAIRGAMAYYQTEKVRLAREEEAKILSRVGEGKGKLKFETAVKKMGEVEKPMEKIATASGGLRFREDKKLRIVDIAKVPREYMVVDEKKVLDALKGGASVPGCEIELVQVPINSR